MSLKVFSDPILTSSLDLIATLFLSNEMITDLLGLFITSLVILSVGKNIFPHQEGNSSELGIYCIILSLLAIPFVRSPMMGTHAIYPVLPLTIFSLGYILYFKTISYPLEGGLILNSIFYSSLTILLAITVVLFEELAVWLSLMVLLSTIWNRINSYTRLGGGSDTIIDLEQEIIKFTSQSVGDIRHLLSCLVALCGFRIGILFFSANAVYYHNSLTLTAQWLFGGVLSGIAEVEHLILLIWTTIPFITSIIVGIYILQFWLVEIRRLNAYNSDTASIAPIPLSLNMLPVVPLAYVGFWVGTQIPHISIHPNQIVEFLYAKYQINQLVEVLIWLFVLLFALYMIYWRIKPFVSRFLGGSFSIARDLNSDSYDYVYMSAGFSIQVVMLAVVEMRYPSFPFSLMFGGEANLFLLVLIPLVLFSNKLTHLLSKTNLLPPLFWVLSLGAFYQHSTYFGSFNGVFYIFLATTFISIYSAKQNRALRRI